MQFDHTTNRVTFTGVVALGTLWLALFAGCNHVEPSTDRQTLSTPTLRPVSLISGESLEIPPGDSAPIGAIEPEWTFSRESSEPHDECTGEALRDTDAISHNKKSPLAYARPTLSKAEKEQQFVMLLDSIESSAAAGRTLHFAPNIDTGKFEPSEFVDADDADFWSFKPLAPVTTPTIDDPTYPIHNAVDALIANKLIEKELRPSQPASDSDLLRRVCYDTAGLPPTSALRAGWMNSPAHDKYEQVVDELLSDPAFGEHWARFWMDLSRYADSDGYEEDDLRPRAFTFRDFATWSMTNDLSYKLFIQWQIAGDQLEPDNPMAVAATGFLAGAPINVFFPQESERMDELDDIVSTMGRAMLGLTIGCARCHDHRYDPIPTEDYYGLVAIFKNTERSHPYLVKDGGQAYRAATDSVTERRDEILQMLFDSLKEQNISALENFTDEEKDLLRKPVDPNDEIQARLLSKCMRCLWVELEHLHHDTPLLDKFQDRYRQLAKEIERLSPGMPTPPPTGLAVRGGEATSCFVLANGDLKRKGDSVQPGFVTALTAAQPKWTKDRWRDWSPDASTAATQEHYPRTALAVWLCDTEHGAGSLLARVVVNRLWQQYFGRGIVDTPSDFGMEGSNPTHPELLEWLAGELVANDWSLRHIHRLILTSNTYRQSCDDDAISASMDPENHWVWRQNSKRLTAEMLRDSMLMVGGNLNRKMYGPGIMPTIPRGAILNTQMSAAETWPMLDPDDPESFRRSLYIITKRTMSVPLMKLFDAPDGSISCEVRTNTTVPTQALALWNSSFVRSQSHRVAQVVRAQFGEAPPTSQLVEAAYQQVLLRTPTDDEIGRCVAFFHDLSADREVDVLTELCHVLMLTNEFAYRN